METAQAQGEALLELFVNETQDLLQQMEDDLLRLEGDPASAEVLNRLFRVVHTVKGSAGTVGERAIVAFAHVFENVMDRLRKQEVDLDASLASLLLESRDVLVRMVERMRSGADASQTDGLGRATAALQRHAQLEAPAPRPPQEAEAPAAPRALRVELRLSGRLFETGQDPYLLLLDLAGTGRLLRLDANVEALPGFDAMDPERLYTRWRAVLVTAAPSQAIEDVFVFVKGEGDVRVRHVMQPPAVQPQPRPAAPERSSLA